MVLIALSAEKLSISTMLMILVMVYDLLTVLKKILFDNSAEASKLAGIYLALIKGSTGTGFFS